MSHVDVRFRCGVCDACEEDEGKLCAVVMRDQEIESLKAQLAEARAVLKEIEEDNYNCPWPECPGERGLVPHAPECRLAKVIRE